MRIKIAPSILSADFSCLDIEIKKVEAAGADMLHIDVMDGHFVPNITIGPVVVRHIRKVARIPLDVHLMIEAPEKFINAFADAGSDMITLHIETISAMGFASCARRLKQRGIRVGVSLNPSTALSKIKGALKYADFVLVMSVNPGFSGQEFIPSVIPKIKKLRAMFKGDISVDGGVNNKVAGRLIRAGANILASGSYIFAAKDTREAIERIRGAGGELY
jgi:ribulose-phosphate 3-epimerase